MKIPSAEQSANRLVETLHNIAASHKPINIGLGLVIADPPDLQIAWNNIILEPKDLYIDQFLLPNYQRNVKGNEEIPKAEGDIKTSTKNKQGGAGKPRYVSNQHKINNSYDASIKGEYKANAIYTDCGLQIGDLVAILPLENAQKFIVLSKLIYLPEFSFSENSGGGSLDKL